MKTFLTLFTALFASNLSRAGDLPDGITQKCEKAVLQTLREYKSENKWIRVADSVAGHRTYRSSTKIFGQWVEINSGETPRLFIVNSKGIKGMGWEPKSCDVKLSTAFEPEDHYIAKKEPRFTDENFKNLLDKKESFLIYTWSPRMTYSVKLMADFESVAKKLGYKFIPLLDPEITDQSLKSYIGTNFKYKISRVASVEILMREMITHYPTTLVVYRGKIAGPRITGVMTKEQLEFEINSRMLKLVSSERDQK